MYIQITTRCNMSCEHCCYACTEVGEDMSRYVYNRVMEICSEMDEIIVLGGGEPTIHPDFELFLMKAMLSTRQAYVITNGSNAKLTKRLLELSQVSRIALGVEVSSDYYHDPIDEDVMELAKRYGKTRDVTGDETNSGRCNFGKDGGCVCDEFFVKPDGDIKVCGCLDSPILGNVMDVDILENICRYKVIGCYKENPEQYM